MTDNGGAIPQVSPPELKMFLTGIEAGPVKVPGPAGSEQPGIAAALRSGDLTVTVYFPTDQLEDIATVLFQAGQVSEATDPGLYIPRIDPKTIDRIKKNPRGDAA